jgi:hypothetical protein
MAWSQAAWQALKSSQAQFQKVLQAGSHQQPAR